MRYVAKEYLRNTLFVLWLILVGIKMSTFVAFGVAIVARNIITSFVKSLCNIITQY
jgi:hypothetical protein